MKKSVFVFLMAMLSFNAFAEDSKVSNLASEVEKLTSVVKSNQSAISQNSKTISQVKEALASANQQIDSLEVANESLSNSLNDAKKELGNNIEQTNTTVKNNNDQIQSSVQSRTIGGVIALVIVLLIVGAVIFNIIRRMSSSSTAIDSVQDAQKKLQEAQKNLQEESVKLDNKLVELLDKQINTAPSSTTQSQTTPDHSLALKVADEIVRIELNLSRMDSSVKGHRQLTRAVERIKDNFKARGYEISDMLGKPYNEGMKAVATFVTDETIPQGSQIISGITKPQVLFNGTMIQTAQITVSQNN